MFSYSGRVKSPEWRWQRRRADLRHFDIFRHGPVIIYNRLPAGGNRYPICTFPASGDGYPSSSPRAHCTPNKSVPTLRYTSYRSMPEGSYRVQSPGFPKIVYYCPVKFVFCFIYFFNGNPKMGSVIQTRKVQTNAYLF